MYFPNEEMKVNKFRLVLVPRNRDYMSRLGSVSLPPEAYSGEENVHRLQNKVDDIEFYARYAQMKADEDRRNSE